MYLSYYKLKTEPFRLTADPRFLHLAEPHRVVLTTLVEGVMLRKGFIVVTGEIGTGKTMLLSALMQILAPRPTTKHPVCTAFIPNPTLTREELLEGVLDEFEVNCPSTSKPRRLSALQQMLLETQQKGGTAALIIDEAHLLTPELLEEIRLLGNADTYQEKLVQIILCGQPELLNLIRRREMAALQQRIASWAKLRALSPTETRAYIAQRLHAAGLEGPSPFSGQAIEEIHEVSKGVPRLINLMCNECLSIGMATRRREIVSEVVAEAVAALELTVTAEAEPAQRPSKGSPPDAQVLQSALDVLSDAMRSVLGLTAASPVESFSESVNASQREPAIGRSVVHVLGDAMRRSRASAQE